MTHRYPFSVIHPAEHYGRRVATYFNLAYKVFSIKDGGKNRNLLTHAGTCTITDVVFDVDFKGRERAFKLGKRTVHAYAVGTLQHLSWDLLSPVQVESLLKAEWQRITYDLHPDHPEFYLKNYNCYIPFKEAKFVILSGKTALGLF
jgi:hypothetical protein